MKTATGIDKMNRQEVAVQLGKLLADEFVLYVKTLNAHWNVTGADFHSMHVFFEAQYGQLQENIDQVAERMRMLGHYAPATMKNFISLAHLTEKNESPNNSIGFINELLSDHRSITEFLRQNISHFADQNNDASTSDFITGIAEIHEKMAWMLSAHLH